MVVTSRHSRGGVAGFLFQFALRAGEVVLAGVDLAGRQFDEIAVQRVAVLAFQQQVAVVEHRDDDDGAGMDDVFARRFLAIGQAHAVAFDVHQPALEDGFAGQFGFCEVVVDASASYNHGPPLAGADRDSFFMAAMIPSADKKMPGSCEPGGTEGTSPSLRRTSCLQRKQQAIASYEGNPILDIQL